MERGRETGTSLAQGALDGSPDPRGPRELGGRGPRVDLGEHALHPADPKHCLLRILMPIFQSALRGSYGGSGVASGHLVSDAVTAAGTEDETDAGPVGEL